MVVSTYQAASGAGAAAMEELQLQTREVWIKLSLSLGILCERSTGFIYLWSLIMIFFSFFFD